MAKRRAKKRSGLLTFMILLFPAALVMLATTVIMIVGMIPTMVAFIIDRDEKKPAAICVGGFNFCGCLPFAINLWKDNHAALSMESVKMAMRILSQPLSWLLMFGAAAVGWAFYFGIPPIIAGSEIAKAERQIEALKKRKVSLVQEWGPDVAGDGAEPAEPAEEAAG